MGTFTLSGEPPSSGVCLREVVASALLPWGEGREEAGRMTEISTVWEKMQAGGKIGSKSLSKREINPSVCIYLCV